MPDSARLSRLQQAFAILDRHRASPSGSDEDLLAAHPDHADLLEPLLRGEETMTLLGDDSTVAPAADPALAGAWIEARARPDAIGPFRVLGELGDGGMGVVYLAEQTEPVRRLVALKQIKQGFGSRQAIARFEAERQALALMGHPNVARVYEAGQSGDGRPWVAMEYVPGESITSYCDRHRLTIEQRIELFLQVCDGVHHAHQKAIIHRDLKPSNVLVCDRDGRPTPVVIDFGIAKPLGQRLTERTLAETGHLVGTPEYMSPEQISGRVTDVDTRTDVHGLGLLLYELLAGVHAFDLERLRAATLPEVARIVLEEPPMRPSARVARLPVERLTEIARGRDTMPQALLRSLRGDLDWIVLKALEKDRPARYASVVELAEDLRRCLRHEAVSARSQTSGYLLRRFLRRRRGLVASLAGVLLALSGGLVTVGVFAASERKARTEYSQLSLLVHLEKARAAEQALHPAWPDTAPRLRSWLDDRADPLLARLPGLRRSLAEVERRAPGDPNGQPSFEDAEDEFLVSNLRRLIADLEAFESEVVTDVRSRLEWAETVEGASVTAHEERWREAIEAIRLADGVAAHESYRGMPPMRAQLGLVPIGMNPATRLWEFYHLRSGADDASIPTAADYDARGRLDVDTACGIVFVLVPPGSFTMGAQSEDSDASTYDADASVNESPPHRVELDAFFVARHELTQAQWMRLGDGSNPSYTASQGRLGRPVESVPWDAAHEAMWRHGLALPTEAQWEYACRAGSTSVWWTGDERETLVRDGVALNIADQSAARLGARWREIRDWEELDDGFPVHADVDAGRPNPWGLHFVCGNVLEWCRDEFVGYDVAARPGDGLREGEGRGDRCVRGGAFMSAVGSVRSANRDFNAPTNAINVVGLRASRPVVRGDSR